MSSVSEVGNPALQGLRAGPTLKHGLPAGRSEKSDCSPNARPVSGVFQKLPSVFIQEKTSGERHVSGRITNWPSQVD